MKPLHVRVAEALGCRPVKGCQPDWACRCKGEVTHREHDFHPCHDGEGLGCDNKLAEYDTDWAATGPLIEEFGITVVNEGESWLAGWDTRDEIGTGYYWREFENAPGPLLAVCALVLLLHEKGLLARNPAASRVQSTPALSEDEIR